MTGNDLREQICGVLLEALPELKRNVRSYMSQPAVKEPDLRLAIIIWRALDGAEDKAEKLSQSEME